MQLNGLSLKPDDTIEPGRFIPPGGLRPEIFCKLSPFTEDRGPDFFPGLLGAHWTCAKSGGYACYRTHSFASGQ